jgi:hypothetical protein
LEAQRSHKEIEQTLVQCGSQNAHKWQEKCAFLSHNAYALEEVFVSAYVHFRMSLLGHHEHRLQHAFIAFALRMYVVCYYQQCILYHVQYVQYIYVSINGKKSFLFLFDICIYRM